MIAFADTIVAPYLNAAGYRKVCEIGASRGEHTDRLLETTGVSIDIIDPCLDVDLHKKYEANSRITVHAGRSLEVLPEIDAVFDCILIDGDHNWYTVFNELSTIHDRGLLRTGGTIFLHDVGWPYGRRDMYYLPDTIPLEFRHPYRQSGIVQGQSELSDSSLFNRLANNAAFEGGRRNGVLAAIEDFLDAHHGQYTFFRFEEEFGLGVLYKQSTFGSATVYRYRLRATLLHVARRLKHTLSRDYPAIYAALKRLRGERK